MNDTEYAEFASKVLGRPVGPTDQVSYDDLRAIRLAEAEQEIAERTAAAEAALAAKERQKRLEADPLFERKEQAARLREEAAAEEAKYQDALTLVRSEHGHELPDGSVEELDKADLYRLAYGEGRDTFMDLADDYAANRAGASRRPAKTEAEVTADMYRAREARERAAYDALHTKGDDQ
jgi:hypothetical protein